MHLFIIILTVIISVLLILIVLVQKSKGGGLSSQFGNMSATMGVRQTNTFLEKGTWWLAGLLVVLSIVSVYTIPSATGDTLRTQQEQSAAMPGENQYATDAPSIPVPDQPVLPEGNNE
ncbi:MAG: preprotein translocase subunit SecG [Bacteroidales bacterium]|nr:preprotein translocase subunit SecG [Bacteroidales bacterium]